MTTKLTISAMAATLAMLAAAPAHATSLSRSVDVDAPASAVWSMIGPFCAIRDWHPAIGTCLEGIDATPTRTLVTRDGKATFVEQQIARDDAAHLYSYMFRSSPLPVTHYTATLKVTAKSKDVSTVTWSSTFTPDRGKETDATDALSGIYEAGLSTIKARFGK